MKIREGEEVKEGGIGRKQLRRKREEKNKKE